MVASDRSVGGFCHAWGEEKPEVLRKKRMLEEEGVVFDEGGGKIRGEFFVGSASSPHSTRRSKTASDVRGKREVANAPSKSKYFATGVTEEVLKREVLNLLRERRAGKTC